MAEVNKDDATVLRLNVGGGKEIVLKETEGDKAGTYFKAGPLKAFFGYVKDSDEMNGSMVLQMGIQDSNEASGYRNAIVGNLYCKHGSNGPFLTGDVGGVVPVDGKTYVNLAEYQLGEDGKRVNTVRVTANIEGPKAEKIFGVMPAYVSKAAAAAAAEVAGAEPEAPKSKPRM